MSANPKTNRLLRVCYFGTYRANYGRNRLMIARLRQQGVEVVECHSTLWKGLEDREQIAGGGWLKPAFWWRVIRAYTLLIWRYLHSGRYDILMVGYPGQADVPLARLLSWLRRKPLVWDIMMSIYLIALERRLDQRNPFSVRLIHWLEKTACSMPDLLLVDTPEYSQWYEATYNIPSQKIRLIPLGADDQKFKPFPAQEKADGIFCCLYYGTFIRNHGVEYIVEAARLLAGEPSIHFEMIGQGPQRDQAVSLAHQYNLSNITFVDWLDVEDLIQHIARADVCLGTFGITPQALMTFQHKIHEGLAMAKPVINGDSPIMRNTLKHGEQIFICERENPPSLAQAILTLRNDPGLCTRIAWQGYEFYQANFNSDILSRRLKDCIMELVR